MHNTAARNVFFLALIVCIGLIVSGIGTTNAQSPQPSASVVTCADYDTSKVNIPPVPTVIDSTCAFIPRDLNGTPGQPSADIYAWLTFIAVNWPVNPANCTANAQASILTATPNPTWLSYLSDDAVFVPKPRTPTGWCGLLTSRGYAGAGFLPPKVRALAAKHPEVTLFLHHNAKGDGLISTVKLLRSHGRRVLLANPHLQGILDATGLPVVDQNGRFVRYTVSMNRDEYRYIMAKKLWTAAGQTATGPLTFPTSAPGAAGAVGAMEFKAAWKVLGKNDDQSHFFTRQAIVYNDVNGSPSPGANPVTVGLVGLHITHKTARQPHWLWATFEQTDNPKSFNNPNCPAAKCPPNVETAPTPFVELNPNGTPRNKPVQVVGVIPTTAASLNTTFQGLLGNTPWAHYKLISTQWEGNFPPGPKPNKLGNSVLETFVAKTVPYSCLNCHGSFAYDVPAGNKADFSFLINAQQ